MYFLKILKYICFVFQFIQIFLLVESIDIDDSESASVFYDDDGVNSNKKFVIVEGLILSDLRLKLAMKVLLEQFGMKSMVYSVVTTLFSLTPFLYGMNKTNPLFLSMQHDLGVSGTDYDEAYTYAKKLEKSLSGLPKTKIASVIYYSDRYGLAKPFQQRASKLANGVSSVKFSQGDNYLMNFTARVSKWLGSVLEKYDSNYVTDKDTKMPGLNEKYLFALNGLNFESLWDTPFEYSNYKFWAPSHNLQWEYLSHIGMISKTELMFYTKNDFLQSDVLEMPMNSELSMVIVRPKLWNGKNSYNLDALKYVMELIEKYPKSLNDALAGMWRVRVKVRLPVMNVIKTKINLKRTIIKMGKAKRSIFKSSLNILQPKSEDYDFLRQKARKSKLNGCVQNVIVNITGAAKSTRRLFKADVKPRADVTHITELTIDGLFLFFIIHRREILVAGTYTGRY